MDPVVVVGAGLAGVSAARELTRAGVPVVVLDRGRRVGGRMASRRTDGRPVDIGASYLTVSDPGFEAVVADWQQRGLARPWTDTFDVVGAEGRTRRSGPLRWAAARGLRSLVEDLAEGLDVRQVEVEQVDGGQQVAGLSASAVLLALPDPQARRLLGPSLAAERELLDVDFEPVLALTGWWQERTWGELDGVFVNDDPVLSWVADDGRRRGDDAPVLVAHTTPELARAHLEAPDGASAAVLETLGRVLGTDVAPREVSVHRWTFARPSRGHGRPFHLSGSLVGFCGDAWSERPRVEAAWVSGTALARELLTRL